MRKPDRHTALQIKTYLANVGMIIFILLLIGCIVGGFALIGRAVITSNYWLLLLIIPAVFVGVASAQLSEWLANKEWDK